MNSSLKTQLTMWATQETQRMELNDDFRVPRLVEHFAYFRRRRSAEVAATELDRRGFAVVVRRQGLKTMLQATREEFLGRASVESFLREVIDIVERANGDYDGWGAPVEALA